MSVQDVKQTMSDCQPSNHMLLEVEQPLNTEYDTKNLQAYVSNIKMGLRKFHKYEQLL